MPSIAVDAMGSDAAPRVEVEGVLAAVRAQRRRRSSSSATSRACAPSWPRSGASARGPIVVRHAPDVITMHDSPSMAVKQKKQSSMRVCFDLVKAGEADAVVSAGNSGAMMACGLFVLGRLPGVERPAIVTTFPDQGRRVRAARHGRQRRSEAGGARAVRGAGLGVRAPAARQGAAAGGPAVERLRGAQGHAADARRAPAADARPIPPAAPTSATSATSRGATSSAARSTSSSPTASPATSCSRASRAPRR